MVLDMELMAMEQTLTKDTEEDTPKKLTLKDMEVDKAMEIQKESHHQALHLPVMGLVFLEQEPELLVLEDRALNEEVVTTTSRRNLNTTHIAEEAFEKIISVFVCVLSCTLLSLWLDKHLNDGQSVVHSVCSCLYRFDVSL